MDDKDEIPAVIKLPFILFCVFLLALTFQYSLFSFFGKDIDFKYDLLIGCLICTEFGKGKWPLASMMIDIFIFCVILRACGSPTPFVN